MKLVNGIKEKKEWLVLAVMAAVIFFFGTYRIWDVGQPILYEDEFGYWSNSSFFLGQDWSSMTSRICYYSYGYSLLLVPIRLLTKCFDWNWRQMYEAVIVMQSLMLVAAFLIAVKLCKRYLKDFHWLVRDFTCLAVLLYPTYVVYAHIAWTETTLAFLVWVFLYMMMRIIDKPTVGNHICFALVAFYMYTVHQRCLAAVIAAIMMVLYLKLLKENNLRQTAAFLGTLYIYQFIHAMIKGKLQNDFYLAKEPLDWKETLSCAADKKALLLLALITVCLLSLYLIDRGKARLVLCIGLIALGAGVLYLVFSVEKIGTAANTVDGRIAVNDFAGQIGKVRDIFTLPGFLRLLISIAGKWFYLASATGLIICFGIWNLGRHMFRMLGDGVKRIWYAMRKKECAPGKVLAENRKEDIWFFGAFLLWMGVFGICVLYVMGIYRVDNLIYGRYHEIAAGFLILYGFYSMVKDRKWVRHMILFVTAYLLVGWLCQYLFDALGNTVFELCHSVMLGRVFANGEVPNGKIWELASYVVPAGILVCMIVHIGAVKLPKLAPYRMIAVLMSVICVWTYMGNVIVEDYVISVNHRQEKNLPTIAVWINRLNMGEKIYFLQDTKYYRWGLALQYDLFDKELIMANYEDISPDEEAFYVVGTAFGQKPEVAEKFSKIVETGQFTILVPRDGEIYGRLERYGF